MIWVVSIFLGGSYSMLNMLKKDKGSTEFVYLIFSGVQFCHLEPFDMIYANTLSGTQKKWPVLWFANGHVAFVLVVHVDPLDEAQWVTSTLGGSSSLLARKIPNTLWNFHEFHGFSCYWFDVILLVKVRYFHSSPHPIIPSRSKFHWNPCEVLHPSKWLTNPSHKARVSPVATRVRTHLITKGSEPPSNFWWLL